ncbi:dTDP-glucose 4,6-dehydratase [Litorivivens sp.]|uniref:dTDP-glucose 4,6-dehydratase n=1 Tax=Litorivivens sp. TaxID=2020868 RepID=UPI003567B5E4
MTRKMLVTGGAGFIGCNFVHYWKKAYPADEIVVLDALTYAGNRANLAAVENTEGFHFVHGDINDTPLVEQILRDHQLNTIVHFAAESHVDRSITGPDAFIETNVLGTHSLLKAARSVWLAGDGIDHRFHHVSTDEVYGSLGPTDPAFAETHQYQPNSPYSASKAASDHLVRAYHHTYGLNVTTSNCSNNYGPYHFPEKLIPLAITRLLTGGTIPVYGDGKNIRDWLYVEDHARGIDAVLNKGVAGEVYNIGGHNEWDNLALIDVLCTAMDNAFDSDPGLSSRFPRAAPSQGKSCHDQIVFVEDRAGHDRRYAIDAEKTRKDLGFRVTVGFEEGIAKTIGWYLDNAEWWSP